MYVNKPLHINVLSALYISANKHFSVTISTVFALIDAHCASAEQRCASIKLKFTYLLHLHGHISRNTLKTLIGIQQISIDSHTVGVKH